MYGLSDLTNFLGNGARTAARTAVPGLLLLLGACSVPDWADPSGYFGSSYGPAPQPVARAGAPKVNQGTPAQDLTAASRNVQRTGSRPVTSVAQAQATTPTAATPTIASAQPRAVAPAAVAQAPQQQVAAAAPAPTPAPALTPAPTSTPARVTAAPSAPTATTGQSANNQIAAAQPRQAPTTQIAAAAPRSPVPAQAAPATATAGSPTPMIAAMTQGQQPPSFGSDGSVVPRRTSVQATSGIADRATGTGSGSALAQTAIQPTSPSTPMQQAAMAAPVPPNAATTTTLSRTYEQELRAAGINPAAGSAPVSGRVQPGQFPQSVSPIVRQTYAESLSAPRSYQEAVGGYQSSVSSSGAVVIGGDSFRAPRAALNTGGPGQPAATVQFGHGSAALGANDAARLRQVAELALRQQSNIEVVGHASSRTGQMPVDSHLLANLRISARRAESVADALARYGVPYSRIRVVARGDNAPVYNEAMPRGEDGNRRAEVYLLN